MANIYTIFLKTFQNGITLTYILYHYFAIGTLTAGRIMSLLPKDDHVVDPGYEKFTLMVKGTLQKLSDVIKDFEM